MGGEKKEADIKKMAALLRKRATMLDLSCPKCDNILFKLQNGKIYCPSCDKEVIVQKEEEPSKILPLEQKTHKPINKLNISDFKDEINTIRDYISIYCVNLRDFQDDIIIEAKLDIIEKLLNIYRSLLEINS